MTWVTSDVEAAGGDVGGDDDVEGAVAEALEGLGAVALLDVGVQGGGAGALDRLDPREEGVGLLLRAGEDHDALEIGLLDQLDNEFVALVHADGVEGVADGLGGGAALADLD